MIIGTYEEIAIIAQNCYGNCKESNCIFKDLEKCPLENEHFEIKENEQ